MPELTAQPKSAPEAQSGSDTDSDPEWAATQAELQALQEMLAHSATQQCTEALVLADLDAQQAACNTPSAIPAAQQQEAHSKLADLVQKHATMANIQHEYCVWLEYCQMQLETEHKHLQTLPATDPDVLSNSEVGAVQGSTQQQVTAQPKRAVKQQAALQKAAGPAAQPAQPKLKLPKLPDLPAVGTQLLYGKPGDDGGGYVTVIRHWLSRS